MAVPHYSYLKLKMPGNNGTTITVHGSFSCSDNCNMEFQKIASKFGVKQEIKTLDILPKKIQVDDRASKPDEVYKGKKSKK
jgi:nitric oxide synthase oxygenase domain/subunit